MADSILEVRGLKTYFYGGACPVKAVDGVTFSVGRGKVFGLVGESGSGKTLTALSVMRLLNPPARIAGGSIIFDGIDLTAAPEGKIASLRGARISMVFQEPATALNPVFTAGFQICEAILAHRRAGEAAARREAITLLERVRIPSAEKVFGSYPHELSGGMRQRVVMAMAIANSPDFIIFDEPTTALDVTIEAEILSLISELIRSKGISALFISHDFGLIRRMCDDVAVMRRGRIVESGAVGEVLSGPQDKYTQGLLESLKEIAG